jgi:hypothetical protein
VAALLYTLLVVALLAGIALSIWWARRLRPAIGPREDDFIAEDSEDLREAVESGRSALRTVDDAGRHHRVLRGHGDQPGRTRRGQGHRRYARRAADARRRPPSCAAPPLPG